MALPRAFKTFGELATMEATTGDWEILQRLIEVFDQMFPATWRNWKVVDFSKTDLFGQRIDPQIFNKLRFAIPTVSLVKAFNPDATAVSEKTFKSIKLALLEWPLCRALIISPKSVASRIHGSSANLELFLAAISEIKSSFISREEVEKLILDVDKPSRKRRSSSQSLRSEDMKRSKSDSEDIKTLKKQTKALQEMVAQLLHNHGAENVDYSDDEEPVHNSEEVQPYYEMYDKDSCTSRSSSAFQVPDLNPDIPEYSANMIDLSPCVKEAEPKIIPAPDDLLDQGVACQRFGKATWANLRYVEVQKKLRAAPAFTSLSVNTQLSAKTPNWIPYEHIVKFDQTLGAMTHGLLLQRKLLKESLVNLANEVKSKTLNEAIIKNVTGSDTEFRKVSDDLLQYICGRRAEVIEYRRSVYKPPSKYMHSALHKVPPSSSYLFDEDALSETFRANGGYYKFFPAHKVLTDCQTNRPERRTDQFSSENKVPLNRRKSQAFTSSSTSMKGFKKPFEAKPNNKKRGGGHAKSGPSPRKHSTKPF